MARMNQLEEGLELAIDFGKIAKAAAASPGIAPVAIQDFDSGEVILLAYTNELAFRKTVETGKLVLWSTSRNKLWEKGATSENTFQVVEIRVNCEQNSLLYRVRAKKGGICHTSTKDGKARNCFYRRLNRQTMKLESDDP